MPRLTFDARLLSASIELEMLEAYLELIEDYIRQSEEKAEDESRAQSFELDYPDWQLLNQQLDWKVEFVLARVLRTSFLATLFAVYETIVTEVADQVQKKKKVSAPLSAIGKPRGFVDRAKQYYKERNQI